jgi:hypothetical protein
VTRRGIVLALALVGGCAASESSRRSDHRYVNHEQGYSVDQPDGWTTSTDRGATRFAPAAGASKQTIVVRSAPAPRELTEGKRATRADLVTATARVLDAMPGVQLAGPVDLGGGGELDGVRFSLTFVPSGLHATYRRTHVVLFGATRIFHVIATAPASEPIDEDALKDMVMTLKEEV